MILTTIVNPNGKNVENWMLELEGMMRVSIRDAMYRVIVDYTEISRPLWPGMIVLNGSQMQVEQRNGRVVCYERF